MSIDPSGVGQPGFVGRHGLASAEREALVQEVAASIRSAGLRTVRLAVADQHGVPRGQDAVAAGGDRGHVRRARLLRRDLQPGHRQWEMRECFEFF